VISARRGLQLYVVVVVLYVALAAWWVVFFSSQGERLVQRVAETGVHLSAPERAAVRTAVDETTRMFLYEGTFVFVLLLASMVLVWRASRREIALEREQNNFLSAVTHELRSPIASARLYVESLRLGRVSGDRARHYLERAHADLGRLSDLTETLLESRRLASTGPRLRAERVDLDELVRRALERVPSGGAAVDYAGSPRLFVRADPRSLEGILDNLITNAIKYGGEVPRVEVSLARQGDDAVLRVRDHGVGLRGADPDRIFEPFLRGGDEGVRTHRGVGLGLFVVRQHVEAHGGDVTAREPDGGGCEFRVRLPALPEEGA